jgi:hypothetical protein
LPLLTETIAYKEFSILENDPSGFFTSAPEYRDPSSYAIPDPYVLVTVLSPDEVITGSGILTPATPAAEESFAPLCSLIINEQFIALPTLVQIISQKSHPRHVSLADPVMKLFAVTY